MKDWMNWGKLDQSIILYCVDDGKVWGGSDSKRKVKQVEEDSDGFYPGGDFIFELDLSNRSLVMEINDEKITIDANLGDFEYSPFLWMWTYLDKVTVEVTIL